jgi:hypothetical protein
MDAKEVTALAWVKLKGMRAAQARERFIVQIKRVLWPTSRTLLEVRELYWVWH